MACMLLLLAPTLTAALPAPAPSSLQAMMEIESAASLKTPPGWTKAGRAPPTHVLELTFAVKQTNLPALTQALMAASDPASPTYGQWLSNEAVHALVAPAQDSVDAVLAHLDAHTGGAVAERTATLNSDFITQAVTVELAERILNTTFHRFEHQPSGHVVHRAESYSLPASVASAVDFVAPSIHLPTIPAAQADFQADESRRRLQTQKLNTPSVLRTLYSIPADTKGKAPKNKQAVTAFLKQYYSASDLEMFWKKYFPVGEGTTLKNVGDAKPGRGGIESMLDAEYATGVGLGVDTEFWGFTGTAPDNKENEPFLKWLLLVAGTSDADVPLIFSTSYGEDENSVSWAYASRIVVEFQKVGARGITLLFASGDSGAAGDAGGCDGAGSKDLFSSKWPAGSPWVTGVGATEHNTVPGNESAASLSSGGFSYRWEQGSWQTAAAAAYVAELGAGPPAATFFNGTMGAGFPDISAQGVAFAVVAGGQDEPGVAGTSCASPTTSGVFALLNDARLSAGKKQLGFLNPMIYANAASFNDVTTGRGGGCQAAEAGEVKGFPALKGWDPVTGVGTPNYAKLLAVVSALP